MTQNEIASDVQAIQSAILQWAKPTITGGQIASLIQSSAPDLDIRAAVNIPKGSGALTAFIKQYLSEQLDHIGKQGMDTLHHVKGREIQATSTVASPEIWRTFVSPNSRQQLVLSKSSGLLISREAPALSEDELDVPKATVSEHDAIRAEFTKSLPPSVIEALDDSLTPNAEFEEWMTALRSQAPEETRSWGHFRRKRLSHLLKTRVSGASIEAGLRVKVLAQIHASEAAAYEARKSATKATPDNRPETTQGVNRPAKEVASRALSLAHAAIDRLSYDELRALKIPLGALLDAVHTEY